jgi:hypothetical protein
MKANAITLKLQNVETIAKNTITHEQKDADER